MEQLYRYQRPSRIAHRDSGPDVRLSTSGGFVGHTSAAYPRFFEGFLGQPEQMAAALLLVARVARTRFYVPPSLTAAALRFADPVVTSSGDRLRFESFSACGGVHARLDVLPEALDGPALATGTTNVDFNPPMRQALASIGGLEPLHLAVGEDLTLTTMDATVTEERVPLPTRWLKGFAEVQIATAGMRPIFDLTPTQARKFVASLPAASGRRGLFFAASSGDEVRLTGRPRAQAVRLAGPERLRLVEPLLRFTTGMRAYGPPTAPTVPAASAWELQLVGARLTVTLSPEVTRGFSGEGRVLRDLADPRAAVDADRLARFLSWQAVIDVAQVAQRAKLTQEHVVRALNHLGAAGRVGFDLAEAAWFHRELPYDTAAFGGMHPRLRDAQRLLEDGAVQLLDGLAIVRSRNGEQTVLTDAGSYRCSCPWFGRHQDNRGPCKHILAVELVTGAQDDAEAGRRD